MDEKQVADYFVLAGLPDENPIRIDDSGSREGTSSPPPFGQANTDPITDITVIIRSQGEAVPLGWHCIETTPFRFPADLNHGSLRSPSVFICYKRGRHKPPLVDIGVLYEGKERVMSDSEVVQTTPDGRPANVNNSNSRTFLTFRRARENAPCNQLVVTDICVILTSKGETPPHAFCLVHKNLNKGMVGSDVFLCYKKSMNRPPLFRYQPTILARFPLDDCCSYSLPESVPLFCMPMGATVECWPKKCQQPRPVFSTFVLTSDSAIKVYGAAVTFYESYPESRLTQKEKLDLTLGSDGGDETTLHAGKSICILSRWSFFDTFEKFLLFLYRMQNMSEANPMLLPIERYISHFMVEVPFPTIQRPKILVQLISTSDETVLISQPPEDMPLPLSGASFTQLLRNLGPENCLNVLLLTLLEQKILLHSLRPDVLTGVAEALTSLIFPFHWQCPYIPLCPLGFSDVLNAPLPFIVGVDSRYFDFYEPPLDVICVDLDTNSIYLSENKRSLNIKSLPKRPTRTLKSTLDTLFERLTRPSHANNGTPYSSQTNQRNRISTSPFSTDPIAAKKFEHQVDLEIQEAFVRFMATILREFRSYLLPITRAPTAGATDTESLFDVEGFLKSRDKNYHRFYQLLMKTQMFSRFIEERSFVSDKDTSLAFFDECLDKIEKLTDGTEGTVNLRLIDADDYLKNDRTVFIPAPEASDDKTTYTYHSFGPLDPSLYHVHPVAKSRAKSLAGEGSESTMSPRSQARYSLSTGSPLSRRTKQEIRAAQRIARRHSELPLTWAKCLVSYCYSLWYIQLPAYVKGSAASLGSKGSPLRIAIEVLQRMQSLGLHPLDEVCYRVLMLLCGEYSQPVLAVKVLFEMKQNGVIPNAITYGYYNKAVLESKWPAGDTTAALLWTRLRNVVSGVSEFKRRGRQSRSRKVSTDETPKQQKDKPIPQVSISTSKETDTEATPPFIRSYSMSSARKSSLTNEKIDFKESNAFRKRTGSIVKASPTTVACVSNFDSAAGLLISSTNSSDMFLGEKKTNSAVQSPSSGMPKIIPHEHPNRKSYIRSLSFGNDAGIINSMREESLKALKLELESNGLAAPEELTSARLTPSKGGKGIQKPQNLALVEEAENETSEVKASPDKPEEFIDPLTAALLEDEELRKANELAIKETETTTPIKDLSITGLFSPDSKFSSSIRSGFRIASQRMSTPSKSNMPRSLTFTGATEKISKFGALFRSKTIGDDSFESSPQKTLNRSATLPTTLEGHSAAIGTIVPIEPTDKRVGGSQTSLSNLSDKNLSTQKSKASQESLSEISASTQTGASPWTSRLSSKHFDYVNSTIKSAASSMASRLSEIKSSLSTVNSPAKANQPSNTGNQSVIGGTASLISQWANKVSEKASASFAFDDEDWDDESSLGDRRLSDEDLSIDRSREGSFARVPPHPERYTGTAQNTLFDTLETHYTNSLEPFKVCTKLIEIDMTSCCRCYSCSTLLFDEEIMEGWSADDSNLNSICPCCNTAFVPILTITVKSKLSGIGSVDSLVQIAPDTSAKSTTDDSQTLSTKGHSRQPSTQSRTSGITDVEPLTVPYLSPLVLRKEVENVLEHEGDMSLLNHQFVDEHPIIYWNLMWYFKRINLPSHLPGLILKSTISKEGIEDSPKYDYRNVAITCYWDNDELHDDLRKPMYRLWTESSTHSSLIHALAAEERNIARATMKQIINSVQCNDILTPMKLLLNERQKIKPEMVKSCYNLYRDILFLAFASIGRENIDLVSFDREYRRAFDSVGFKQQALLIAADRPPSFGAIFCRRFFRDLDLKSSFYGRHRSSSQPPLPAMPSK